MERALEKIRPHTLSSLPHQKTPATLLVALESTLSEQKADPTPTAYFAVLLTTLEGTLHKKDAGLEDGDILPGVLYLLALVIPFVPQAVIQANLSTILTLTSPLFPALHPHAPPLRSQLTLYHSVFLALDRTKVETQGVRQAFATIMQLCLDPRPKVRKRAADLVKDVLASPPAPLQHHPYADRVAEWVNNALVEVSQGPIARGKQAKSSTNGDHAIHLLAFLRPILAFIPRESLVAICTLLLSLPRLGNSYLSQSAYSILSDLCSLEDEDDARPTAAAIPEIIKAILSFPPARSDPSLSSSWIHLIGTSMVAYRSICTGDWSSEVGKAWKTVWVFLESKEAPVRKEAANTLSVLSSCFNAEMVQRAVSDEQSTVGKIISQSTQALDALAYARCIPETLSIISALITNVAAIDVAATEKLFSPVIQRVGQLRTEKTFEQKEDADSTLLAAMQTLGPEVLLRLLPLNLEPTDRAAGQEPRAYLLPLLAHPHPSPLGHFVSYFVPLSERMFDLQQKAEIEGRQSEGKVWDVLVGQTWSGFSAYCHGTPDLDKALTKEFSQLISQLLYSQPTLRPAIVKGLKAIVESNVAIVEGKATVNPSRTSVEHAQRNIEFLRTQTESWLSVFFNVFGSVNRDSRNAIGDLIASWVSIAGDVNVSKAYHKVVGLFNANLPKAEAVVQDGSMLVTTLDLLIILLPSISPADSEGLFQLCLSQSVLCSRDNGVQKRAYKILGRLAEGDKASVDSAAVIKQLADWSDGLLPAAKKDRCTLLAALVSKLEPSALHLIPILIPEAVLGTKETSDKARSAAFSLVLAMGHKMAQGGVVKRDMIDGMEEEHAQSATASIEEFMMMMAGGLAGASPHMISATVTAISRLVFEFKDDISSQMHTEIFTTLLVFLTSANREIVKSILGFIKLAIHSLPVDIIRPHLGELVPALLGWSHDHKNHFKAKVRHIFERVLRRFSWQEVYSCAGEEEAAKVLVNIKKRKERAKRKKANREEESDDEAPAPAKAKTGDAFEDVLYGSESELDDSDDDQEQQPKPKASNQRKFEGARLRVDNDDPMDLLHGAATQVTTASSNNRRRKPGQDASKFKTDDDTGKMVIDDEDAEAEADDGEAAMDVAGAAYKETLTSVDGFKRGPNGRVKFNKDTKKRRREEAMDEDVEMGEESTTKAHKPKRRSDVKLGHEFKAKKAGGDVKKGGVDPYAYLTLSQASKRGGRKGVSGKR